MHPEFIERMLAERINDLRRETVTAQRATRVRRRRHARARARASGSAA